MQEPDGKNIIGWYVEHEIADCVYCYIGPGMIISIHVLISYIPHTDTPTKKTTYYAITDTFCDRS